MRGIFTPSNVQIGRNSTCSSPARRGSKVYADSGDNGATMRTARRLSGGHRLLRERVSCFWELRPSASAHTPRAVLLFQHGPHALRNRCRPVSESIQGVSPASTARHNALLSFLTPRDGLRNARDKTLGRPHLDFEFHVQLWANAQTRPIEDAIHKWSEQESGSPTVADLTLPVQDIRRQHPESERRCFSAWNALAAPGPLGGINRVQKQAYALSVAGRHAVIQTAA